jgi:predicted component of viral defense system (DUF524 family)
MRALTEHDIVFRNASGALLAKVRLTPVKDAATDSTAPLVLINDVEAREHGETIVQLRESERYEYQVISENGQDLRLRCSLSSRRKSLGEAGLPDAGLIETRTFCGALLLELVAGPVEVGKVAAASTIIDVRSLKLDYRTEYRGMLRRLTDEIAALVADARSSAKVGFRSSFEERRDEGWLQLQLELLREILDGADFSSAMQRIVSYPHESLSTVMDSISVDRPMRWKPSVVRQLVINNPRREVPAGHPLRVSFGLHSVAERVSVPSRSRDLDTPENRFIKFALGEFRSFLAHAQSVFEGAKGWGASASLSRRLASSIDDWLGRSFFRDISAMRIAPLGSPVLQRKSGYREVLRWWLRFKTAAEISWVGGEDLFRAGQRDVASLYEYWLFFELLDWFMRSCRVGSRPSVEELVEGLEEGSPNLRLKKRVELGPFEGAVSMGGRKLNARFSYNKRFGPTSERAKRGSWSRALHPDYTLSFWPEGFDEAEAEREELLVHIHFDAKYRVENLEGIFGADDGEDADEEVDGNYKRQDLLKMHAYRDAIKRSQGAYILYPGRAVKPMRFSGFHEILPGLGAFGVSPDESGKAHGMDELTIFLEEAIAHLCHRATARERSGFHLARSYSDVAEAPWVSSFDLPERDWLSGGTTALPPADHLILIAMRCESSELAWMATNKLGIVRIGRLDGPLQIQSEWSGLRHLIFRQVGDSAAAGLRRISRPGYRVLSGAELAGKGYPAKSTSDAFAVFDVEEKIDMPSAIWPIRQLLQAERACEATKQKLIADVKERRSLKPRLATLAGLARVLAT